MEGAGLNAFVFKALSDAAYLGGEIGEKEDAAKFGAAAKDLQDAFNKVLWDEKDGAYYSGYYDSSESAAAFKRDNADTVKPEDAVPHLPVAGNLAAPSVFFATLALDQGIVPAARRERVKSFLLSHPVVGGRTMLYYYLYKLLFASDTPERDKQVLDGFRTLWKEMVADPRDCSWEDLNGGSHAHIYGMHPGYFLSAYVLGVRRDEPVWTRSLRVEPHLGGLTFAEGKVVTEYGLVPISWKNGADGLAFSIDIPAGLATTLALPAGGGQRLTLNGKTTTTRPEGNRLVTTLPAGHSEGLLAR